LFPQNKPYVDPVGFFRGGNNFCSRKISLDARWEVVRFAMSRLRTDEDGTILVHTLHGSDWYHTSKKGGNAPRATDKKSM
jgi:hypothetical protein